MDPKQVSNQMAGLKLSSNQQMPGAQMAPPGSRMPPPGSQTSQMPPPGSQMPQAVGPIGYGPPGPYGPPASPYSEQYSTSQPYHYYPSPNPAYCPVPTSAPPQSTYPYAQPAGPIGYQPPYQYSSSAAQPPRTSNYYSGSMYPTATPPSNSSNEARYSPNAPPSYTFDKRPLGSQSPDMKSKFRVGMKLEAVDRRFPYFVCVATIMDKDTSKDQLLIHFDGWSADYKYWCSREDIELHPAGWCRKTGWELQPPHGQTWKDWDVYLKETRSKKAPLNLFSEKQLADSGSLLFEPGMKLEARDRKHSSLFRAATIKEVRLREVKVHFDGLGDELDFWCSSSSTDIHPCMWSGKQKKRVLPPGGYDGNFKWSEYLTKSKLQPAPAHLFTKEQLAAEGKPDCFQIGMHLEARDRLNPSIIAVATITDIKDDQLLVHFDGWTSKYDYWCAPNCVDIHPKGWCSKNSKILQPPKGCSGCFDWDEYLSELEEEAAPEHLFSAEQLECQEVKPVLREQLESQVVAEVPCFKVGMKLEAKDRKNPNLTCVATVAKVDSEEDLLIHFDGWTSDYDYWCEPSCTDIHPKGWCENNHITLQPPNNYRGVFDWNTYLTETGSISAPESLFTPEQCECPAVEDLPCFKAGMKLEAKDRKNPNLTCVATIAQVDCEEDLLVHFDGWTSAYDYWCEPSCTDIHPIGWCEKNCKTLQPPKGYSGVFDWSAYLSETSSTPAPESLFTPKQLECQPCFRSGMQLEARDKKNPSLFCVATIADVNTRGELLIHFDGWTSAYDYWCKPDSTAIHPVGWCEENKKSLQVPKGYNRDFKWDSYLAEVGTSAAPKKLFTSAQKDRLCFKPGMKLEAQDRKNKSLTYVATIADTNKKGELLIHLDGWAYTSDYWCYSTSTDIHPKGWCNKNKRSLHPPDDYDGAFDWDTYLSETKSIAAPEDLFTPAQLECPALPPPTCFKAGMKLEAKDRRHPDLTCAATIADINSKGELLIHFDGWTSAYNYWCKPDSADIHPVGWCDDNDKSLQLPKGYISNFSWDDYLAKTGSSAAPENLFTKEQKECTGFLVGMKLEAVDRTTPTLICVATIVEINSKGELLISFDGWTSDCDYWCEPDSADIHPVGWCEANDEHLQAPKGYEMGFGWPEYLSNTSSVAAPLKLFTKEQANKVIATEFQPGMRLEAKDRQNPSMVGVATVSQVDDDGRLLIHFDGWGTEYDYWCEPDSADIRPVGWCVKQNIKLQIPNGYSEIKHFRWERYLQEIKAIAAPSSLFTAEQKSRN